MIAGRRAAWIAGVVLAVPLVGFLLANARPIDPVAHSRTVGSLGKIQELDSELDEIVLKLRDALLTNYDPLVATSSLLKLYQKELGQGDYAVVGLDQDLKAPFAELTSRLAAKDALLEKFKSRNALLRNSFHYLPLSARALSNDARAPRALQERVQELLRYILLLRVGATQSDYALLDLQAKQLRAAGADAPRDVRVKLDVLLKHAEHVIALQEQMDNLVRRITGVDVERAGSALATAYNRAFERRLREANLYRFILIALSLALMAYAVHSFLRLRYNAAQLQLAFDRQQLSEQRYRKLFDLSPDGMLIHTDGVIVLVNSMCMKMLGAANAAELVGRPVIDLFHADYRERTRERIQRTSQEQQQAPPEERKMLKLDGGSLDVEVAASPLMHDGKASIQVVLRDISERKKADERLNFLAQYDSLTSLPNRSLFRDRLEHSLAQAQRSRRPAAVLFMDLDRFKTVNDTLGHAVGDLLLQQAAARLKACVRTGDTVGRFGGDEFAVILTDLAQPGDAGLVAQKLVDSLARPFELDGKTAFVSASIGITLYPSDATEPEALSMNADAAMYRAKEKGGNNYEFFTPEMNERAVHRMRMEAAMRQAIDREEFLLHYQPKVDLASGAICGVEALLRWAHPERGLVSPVEFIPVLEETGLIVPAGEWVTREACRQIRAWQRAGLDVPPVAVNLSARQFQQKNLEQTIRDIMAETGVEPALLQFEITESLLMHDAEAAQRILRGLKSAGVKLSIDDFGTGYSSLAYLRRFALDALKIDRAFIKDVVENPDDAAITLAVINLAHSLNLKVVAEGVETEGQVNLLSLHSCDEIQGYYFSRPLPASEIEAMMRSGRRLARSENFTLEKAAVLLVDDNQDDLRLLYHALRGEEFPVLSATSAEQAFVLLAHHRIGVVVSDQSMPGMNGAHFLAKLGKLYPHVQRIAISGSAEHDIVAEAVNQAGIHKFLSKSWSHERLRSELRDTYRLANVATKAA